MPGQPRRHWCASNRGCATSGWPRQRRNDRLDGNPMEFAATIIILTCTYGLLAAGIVILYKAGRVVNFAHGELAIVGGYVFYSSGLLAGGDEPSLWLAIVGAAIFSVIMGVFIYMAMMRRLVGEPFYV